MTSARSGSSTMKTSMKNSKLTKKEHSILKAAELLKADLKDFQKSECFPFTPACPQCQYHLLYGLLVQYIADLNYGAEKYDV